MKTVILRKTTTPESTHFCVCGSASAKYFESDEFVLAHKYAIAECVRLGLNPVGDIEYFGMPDYLVDGKKHNRDGYQLAILKNLRDEGYSGMFTKKNALTICKP